MTKVLCYFLPMHHTQGGKVPTEWKFWTWTDYWNDCRKFAKALITLKVEKFGVVNIMGFNSVKLSPI